MNLKSTIKFYRQNYVVLDPPGIQVLTLLFKASPNHNI